MPTKSHQAKKSSRESKVRGCLLWLSLFSVVYGQGPLHYGYLSYFSSQTAAASQKEVAWLKSYHISHVQFYDWQWKHHVPLAGTTVMPASSWSDIANRTNYRQTVRDLIDACHANGMKAMSYNLLYGAYADYRTDGSGVDPAWGLYDAAGGSQWAISLPGGWATPSLCMFNPANLDWQKYLYGRENDLFSAYDFDGWHVDQLGDPGLKYDSTGKPVDVWTTFAGFLDNARAATGKSIVFNNVGAYGMFSVASQAAVDAVYVECWEDNGQVTYNDLKTVIDNGLAWGIGKPVILAAYVNRGKTGGSFNPPGVLLADATIFASGGTHIELGDGGYMLCHEYFPSRALTLGADLAETLTRYYDFTIAYKDWLYGGLANSANPVVLSIPAASTATAQKVWAFAKTASGRHLLNLINLAGESSVNWRDNDGTYPVPAPQANFSVKYYYGDGTISGIQLASPDINAGAAADLGYTTGSDARGNYVTFTVPSLLYWDAILIKTAPGGAASGGSGSPPPGAGGGAAPSSPSSGGGGGGAPSLWFLGALSALGLLGCCFRRPRSAPERT